MNWIDRTLDVFARLSLLQAAVVLGGGALMVAAIALHVALAVVRRSK